MAIDKDEIAQRVACALLWTVIDERKPQIQALLKKHGKQPSDDPEELLFQVIEASNERGVFFDGDLMGEYESAGFVGAATVASLALKVGSGGLHKIADAVKTLKNKPKTDSSGNKIKLKDRLKGIFKKKDKKGKDSTDDETKDGDVTPDDMADDQNALDAAKDAGAKDDNAPKKDDQKKIMGMDAGVFWGLLALLVIIVIVIIVLVMRNAKKKKEEAKK